MVTESENMFLQFIDLSVECLEKNTGSVIEWFEAFYME